MKRAQSSILAISFSIFAMIQAPLIAHAVAALSTTASVGGGQAAAAGATAGTAQLGAAAGNTVAAKQYKGICSSVYGSWACPLAVMAGAAALQYALAAKQSSSAGVDMSAWSGYGNTGTDSTGTTYDPLTGLPTGVSDGSSGSSGNGSGTNTGIKLSDGTTPQTISRDISQIKTDLANSGVTVSDDGKTVTTKDGRKFNIGGGSDGSEKSFLDMGMSASEAALAADASRKIGAQVASKYGNLMKISADGSGAGGGRSTASTSDSSDGTNGMNGLNFGPNDPRSKNRGKAKLSGLTKKLGDDTIGVSGDDIFEMVTRRYKARDQENQFLKD